ncbi:MAG: hypothetical protein ABGY42_02035, partial [bacterium]
RFTRANIAMYLLVRLLDEPRLLQGFALIGGAGPTGGSCCDTATSTDPDCTATSPSGAFLDAVVF